MIFTVDLPLCPSANNAYINASKKGRVPSPAHTAWKQAAGLIVRREWIRQGKPTITKPYALHIAVNVDHNSDICNREKLATDLLVSTIDIPGDQWIDQATIVRDRTIHGMRIEIMSLPVLPA